MATKGFQVISQDDVDAAAAELAPRNAPAPEPGDRLVAQTVALLLAGVGKKWAAAVVNAFSALSLGSVFWLALTVMPEPSDRQLIGLAGYAVFILALEIVRRRG